jgi:hypothetical protein
VKSESTVGRLLDGIPFSDQVDYFTYVRYSFKNIYGLARSFRILVTVLSGTPVVYATLDSTAPTFTHYAYHMNVWSGSSSMVIRSSDQAYAPCLDADCDIRIAVWGLVRSSYIISITSDLESTTLQLGVPLQAQVAEGLYDYFKVAMSDKAANLRLSLTELSGYTSMYVSCQHKFPNSSSYFHDWYFYPMSRAGALSLDISPLEALDKKCSDGNFYISVKGYSSATYR